MAYRYLSDTAETYTITEETRRVSPFAYLMPQRGVVNERADNFDKLKLACIISSTRLKAHFIGYLRISSPVS